MRPVKISGRPRRKAVFFDKDGTIIENIPYNVDPANIHFIPGTESCLRRMAAAGYKLVVVSNQSGIARGYFDEGAIVVVRHRIAAMFLQAGVELLDFFYCPHHPGGIVPRYSVECGCRKPNPGMLITAAIMHGIDLSSSWMVGDILDDVEAGSNAGCRTMLVNNGNETEWLLSNGRMPDFLVNDLEEAAKTILRSTNDGSGRGTRTPGGD